MHARNLTTPVQTMAPDSPDYRFSATLPVLTAEGHIRRIRDIEADLIRIAILRYGGNCSLAAERLGISRGTLYRKMTEIGIVREGE